MLDATTYYELVSGRRRGFGAAAMRLALAAVEPLYTTAIRYRNRRYDRGRAAIRHVAVPVISVGNLTLGGTGKTPLVKWIARWLRHRQLRVALVSRGYGAEQGARNDEALELEQALPDVPHLQNADRVAAAQAAIEELAAQVILLDDGFQHRRLARDLDIVLIDAWEPFGFNHVFPRGTLREPISSLRRAQVVCLTRADQVEAGRRDEIRKRVRHTAPEAVWCEAIHTPQALLNANGDSESIEQLRGRRVAAFCGIGNPAAFRRTLEGLGYEVKAWREYPDHHPFTADDVANLSNWAAGNRVDAVICTHKDLVKLQVDTLADCQLKALAIELEILTGREELEKKLGYAIEQIRSTDPLKVDQPDECEPNEN